MNSRNLNYLRKFLFLFVNFFIFKNLKAFVIVVGLIFLSSCSKSNNMENFNQSDPPPIIIKSGSFVVEAENQLNESGGTQGNPYVYKLNGFSLKSVNVCVLDYLKPDAKCTAFNNPVVKIWLTQHLAPGNSPDVTVQQNGNDFDLTIYTDKKLKAKDSSHAKRKYRYEDDDDKKSINIDKIEVNGNTFSAADGVEFVLGFYNS